MNSILIWKIEFYILQI